MEVNSTQLGNAYDGKFVDRYPGCRAAGKLYKIPGNTLEGCLKVPEKDMIFFVERPEGYPCFQPQQPVPKQESHAWPPHEHTELWNLFKSNEKSPFQLLANELAETRYASHWRTPLGRRIHLPAAPYCFNPESLTHGLPSTRRVNAGMLVNPPKSACQVRQESEVGKELYKKSHGDYDPGEQVTRDYQGKFDPCERFGWSPPACREGSKMRRVLKWAVQEPVSYVSIRQADFTNLNKCSLAKRQTAPPCHKISAPEECKFGVYVTPNPSVSLLLGGDIYCAPKQDQLMCLKHINKLRIFLKKRHFSFRDFLNTFKYHDQKCSGQLPIATVDKICRDNRIYINKPIIKLMEILGILDDKQCVQVCKFVDLLNWQCIVPTLPKADVSCKIEHDFNTIYSLSMTGDAHDTSCLRAAGRPNVRGDLKYPRPRRDIRADIGSLEGETDAYSVLYPSIFTNYGLSHRDFFLPRSMAELEQIFSGIGVTLPGDIFGKLWEEGCRLDQTGGVCVETFRNLLQKMAAKNFLKS